MCWQGLQRSIEPAWERLFRALASMLVVMVFVIMTSAVQRMRLYQEAYGMTELRFYTTAFMGWLAVLLLGFLLAGCAPGKARVSKGAHAAHLHGRRDHGRQR